MLSNKVQIEIPLNIKFTKALIISKQNKMNLLSINSKFLIPYEITRSIIVR